MHSEIMELVLLMKESTYRRYLKLTDLLSLFHCRHDILDLNSLHAIISLAFTFVAWAAWRIPPDQCMLLPYGLESDVAARTEQPDGWRFDSNGDMHRPCIVAQEKAALLNHRPQLPQCYPFFHQNGGRFHAPCYIIHNVRLSRAAKDRYSGVVFFGRQITDGREAFHVQNLDTSFSVKACCAGRVGAKRRIKTKRVTGEHRSLGFDTLRYSTGVR